jgi:hypothetical protein
MTSGAIQSHITSALASTLALMVLCTSAGVQEEGLPGGLIMALSNEDRAVIAAALRKKEDGPLHLVGAALERIRTGQPILLGDVVVINSAMMVDPDKRAKPLLNRIRAAASALVSKQ